LSANNILEVQAQSRGRGKKYVLRLFKKRKCFFKFKMTRKIILGSIDL
jgi:hypothetical protein